MRSTPRLSWAVACYLGIQIEIPSDLDIPIQLATARPSSPQLLRAQIAPGTQIPTRDWHTRPVASRPPPELQSRQGRPVNDMPCLLEWSEDDQNESIGMLLTEVIDMTAVPCAWPDGQHAPLD